MKSKSVKSQITMIIIVGFLLFIVVSFVLYLSKSSIKKTSRKTIKEVQETALESQPLKEFVTNCIDKLAKDAIVLLGKQGGRIYASQGGTHPDFSDDAHKGIFFIEYNGFNVAYNIKSLSFPSPPNLYPTKTFPYKSENLNDNEKFFDGSFGEDTSPPIDSLSEQPSIQLQIESFIDKNINDCADFSVFEKQGLEVVARASATSVIIGENDVSVNSKIPITAINPKTNEITEFNEFSTSINVRLKDVYIFTKNLIDQDIENIEFDISSRANNMGPINVQVDRDVYSKDDIIIVADGQSLINGIPFQYVFARKNRMPAVYYIKPTTYTTDPQPNGFDIAEKHLMPNYPDDLKAIDPDEDSTPPKIRALLPKPDDLLPTKLNRDEIKFRIEAADGELEDYQEIIVKRIS